MQTYLIIISYKKEKYPPRDYDWENNAIVYQSKLLQNKIKAVAKDFFISKYKEENIDKLTIYIRYVYKDKTLGNVKKYKLWSELIFNCEEESFDSVENASRTTKIMRNLSEEKREKYIYKNRVNRPHKKTGSKAPAWFVALLELPKGEYLAREIAEKLGISHINLKIVLKSRGIEPLGTKRIKGSTRSFVYYNTSQFKAISKEEIEEARVKLKEEK
ncbi:hypothetical protein [Fluviispira vulneris]|uniref:hypothetical protein n=1 Tax=Fluviispira vulneris TaxID=2763012 RepID=UPI001645D25E|nr:hypothetical protein [Fluviispira vulneris]